MWERSLFLKTAILTRFHVKAFGDLLAGTARGVLVRKTVETTVDCSFPRVYIFRVVLSLGRRKRYLMGDFREDIGRCEQSCHGFYPFVPSCRFVYEASELQNLKSAEVRPERHQRKVRVSSQKVVFAASFTMYDKKRTARRTIL